MCVIDGFNFLFALIYAVLGFICFKQILIHWPSFQQNKAVSLKGNKPSPPLFASTKPEYKQNSIASSHGISRSWPPLPSFQPLFLLR